MVLLPQEPPQELGSPEPGESVGVAEGDVGEVGSGVDEGAAEGAGEIEEETKVYSPVEDGVSRTSWPSDFLVTILCRGSNVRITGFTTGISLDVRLKVANATAVFELYPSVAVFKQAISIVTIPLDELGDLTGHTQSSELRMTELVWILDTTTSGVSPLYSNLIRAETPEIGRPAGSR